MPIRFTEQTTKNIMEINNRALAFIGDGLELFHHSHDIQEEIVDRALESPDLLLFHGVGIEKGLIFLALLTGIELHPHLQPDRLRLEPVGKFIAVIELPIGVVPGAVDLQGLYKVEGEKNRLRISRVLLLGS